MKTVEVWIYAALLAVSVVLAWGVWKGEEPASKGDVVLFDPGPGGVVSIEWDGERNAARLEITGSEDDLAVWVTAGRKKRIVTPVESDDDDSAPAAGIEESTPAPKPEPEYSEPDLKSFPGSKQAENLVAQLSPLMALRQFEGLGAEDLEAMGLVEPKGHLTLRGAGDASIELWVGDKAYGSSDTYVREPDGTTAWLVSSKDLGPLRSASSSLRDRDLLGFEPTDAAAASLLAAGGRSLEVTHEGRHDKDNAHWMSADSEEERDAVADGLMKSVLAMKASTYLKADEQPAEGTWEAVLDLRFTDEAGAELGQLELVRVVDPEKSREDDPIYKYFARSHRLRGGFASVSRSAAEEVGDALEGVLSR